MIRLALLVAVTYTAWRMSKLVVEENRHRLLLPSPSPDNRAASDSPAAHLSRRPQNG
jgi:hypothetical protein